MIFLEVDETSELSNLRYDGVMGLSPEKVMINTSRGSKSVSFIDHLYDN